MAKAKPTIPIFRTGLEREVRSPSCDHPACEEEGRFPAPRAKGAGGEPARYCLSHIRQFNAAYDFFAGWSEAAIENYRKEAVVGHRRTWPLGKGPAAALARDGVQDSFGFFAEEFGAKNRPGLPQDIQQALAKLDLDVMVSLQEIKMRYKQLVKRHHPDMNGGNEQAAERFKSISEAYQRLLESDLF